MPTTLASRLDLARIRVGLHAESKSDALTAMVTLAATSPSVLDAVRLAEAVHAREALMSTGVGQGIAFPHARTDAVAESVAAFAILAEPIDYDALDEEPVRFVLLLAGTESGRKGHVRLLSRASRLFADVPTRNRLEGAETAAEVLRVLQEAEAQLEERV